MAVKRKAVFLDKDGTLVENVPYNVDPARMRFLPGVAEGLAALHRAEYALIVVSNQPGVALGRFAEDALEGVARRLRELFAAAGAKLETFHYCPHHLAGRVARYAVACDCRKPAPGLVLQGAQAQDIALDASWLVGDILDDIEAGSRAGCRTVLVDRGNETEWQWGPFRMPDFVVADFGRAAAAILNAGGIGASPNRMPRELHV